MIAALRNKLESLAAAAVSEAVAREQARIDGLTQP
jgi:hypothetical protein